MSRLFEDPGSDLFRGLNLSLLGVDQAYLVIQSHVDTTSWLYGRSDDCYKCTYELFDRVDARSNVTRVIDTKRGWNLKFRSTNESALVPDLSDDSSLQCQVYASMGEFGVYDVRLTANSAASSAFNCSVSTAKEPVNIYTPILACFLFYVTLALLWIFGSWAYRRGCFDRLNLRRKASATGDLLPNRRANNPSDDGKASKRTRVKSIDVFRGISIVVMIFVNHGGGNYWFFDHATWNGLLVADLVFPWFMWIMGVCVPISIRSSLKRREPKWKAAGAIFRRSCILFVLGLINNSLGGGNNLSSLRIPGVMQRFSICYLVIGLLSLLCQPSELNAPSRSGKWRRAFQDLIVLWPQWLIMGLLVTAHCLITFLLPIDADCPTGYLGPGGRHLNSAYSSRCIGGAAGYIDRLILTTDHFYQWPTARGIYATGPYDPEGILGSLLSVFQVFLGVQAGITMLIFTDWKARVKRWMAWSVLTGAVGAVLCKASQEDGWIPVNKNLWSLSFVLVTSCMAFFLLGVCYFLVDVRSWWNGVPFLYPGMNSILMYMGHQVTYNVFPWHWRYGPMNTHFDLLVEALWGLTLWVLIATWLFYKKFFLAL